MKGLDGKVALITGGGTGLGRSLALGLSARGVRVVVMGREEKALGETVGEIVYGGGKARHVVGDVRERVALSNAAARAVSTFGGLDFVVAAAAVSRGEGDDVLATNLVGVYYTFEEATKTSKAAGRFLVLRRLVEEPCVAARAAHAGVVGLVEAASREPKRIACNAVFSAPELDDGVADHDARATEVALFFCSSAADGVRGQVITVGG